MYVKTNEDLVEQNPVIQSIKGAYCIQISLLYLKYILYA